MNPPLVLLEARDTDSGTGVGPFDDFAFARSWGQYHPAALDLFKAAQPADATPAVTSFHFLPEELDEIAQYNRDAGNPGGAALAELLAKPETRTVVVGQQPNLFGAPLYNIAKAAGAIREARKLTGTTGRPVVPVFWVASDDTDFDELRAFHLPDIHGQWHNLGRLVSRGPERPPGTPASGWVLDQDSQNRLLTQASGVLKGFPGQSQAVQWMEHILESTGKACGSELPFEQLFIRSILSALPDFDPDPILFIVPRLKAFRRAAVPILEADLAKFPRLASLIADRETPFTAEGWPVLIKRAEDAPNFFYHDGSIRYRILRQQDDSFAALQPASRRPIRQFSRKQLLEALHAHPDHFSPGVVARPVVQDYALRPLKYMAGPGELAYLAQIHGPTGLYGIPRAPVEPRVSFVLSAGALNWIGKGSEGPGIKATSGTVANPGFRALLESWTRDLDQRLAPMVADLPVLPVQRAREKTLFSLNRALTRFENRLRRQAVAAGQLIAPNEALRLALNRPLGASPERIYSWPAVLAAL